MVTTFQQNITHILQSLKLNLKSMCSCTDIELFCFRYWACCYLAHTDLGWINTNICDNGKKDRICFACLSTHTQRKHICFAALCLFSHLLLIKLEHVGETILTISLSTYAGYSKKWDTNSPSFQTYGFLLTVWCNKKKGGPRHTTQNNEIKCVLCNVWNESHLFCFGCAQESLYVPVCQMQPQNMRLRPSLTACGPRWRSMELLSAPSVILSLMPLIRRLLRCPPLNPTPWLHVSKTSGEKLAEREWVLQNMGRRQEMRTSPSWW